ncbi:ABC transporter permease [Fodinicola acaciae]|uniref:ABC transporter permease n=1 Tax=Fodinicola acaciae TaxID=2681555 RepID=UPI0013D09333|nr:ABC transporter permease [Fodinicola acaciae]
MGAARLVARLIPVPAGAGLARMLFERNVLVYRRAWIAFVTGFMEPVFYLFSLGIGIGALVGTVSYGGEQVSYASFVAPAMLATSAMNGVVFDMVFMLFFKLKYNKVYESVLNTPLGVRDIAVGESAWALVRSTIYATGFLVVATIAGFVHSWWAVLAVPVAVLIGFCCGSLAMAGTTWMRTHQDFDYLSLVLMPLFLLSATFYPLDTYPPALRWLVQLSPLYHGVTLERDLMLGHLHAGLLVNALVLALVGLLGLAIAGRRLEKLLLS